MAKTMNEKKEITKERTHSKSALVQKYGEERVSRARDIVRAEVGKKLLRKPSEWAAVGEIAKISKNEGRKLTLNKADTIKKRTKSKGVEKGFYSKIIKKK